MKHISKKSTYDQLDPEAYEMMYDIIPRENYMKTHWRPYIEKLILTYCRDKVVLDLGCGYGRLAPILNECSFKSLSMDVSSRWLNYAKTKMNCQNAILADAHTIPVKNGSIDVAICIGLFEFINRKYVLEEINRVLKKGGISIISVPNKYSAFRIALRFYNFMLGKNRHADEPSKREMIFLAEQNGFKLISFKMNDGLIYLPHFIDDIANMKIYMFIEQFFAYFSENPFSNVMVLVIIKH